MAPLTTVSSAARLAWCGPRFLAAFGMTSGGGRHLDNMSPRFKNRVLPIGNKAKPPQSPCPPGSVVSRARSRPRRSASLPRRYRKSMPL